MSSPEKRLEARAPATALRLQNLQLHILSISLI